MPKSESLALAEELLSKVSITPDDAGCQDILIDRLKKLNFNIHPMPFGDVKNFYARKGQAEPLLLFAGHTDVVPPGPAADWQSPPFKPTLREGRLYARGAADMKSSLAAMVCATERLVARYPNHEGSIGFLITSDEEGPAIEGTARVVAELIKRQEKITWCIVGEASSEQQFGDVVKVGRRGSLSGKLIIHGKQGHIAYPKKADNPIHKSLKALLALTTTIWGSGDKYFPATSFQISNIHAGTGANNVIPGQLVIDFNFRYGSANSAELLMQEVHSILDAQCLNYELQWAPSSQPFLSKLGKLYAASCQAIQKVTSLDPRPATDGGTSDGRFIIKTGCEVIEIGPINEPIHQVNEYIAVNDLESLTNVYYEILVSLVVKTGSGSSEA